MSIVRSWSRSALRIEVHLTSEIVTKPPGCACDALINSANASLVGTKLPYFPMQGCNILLSIYIVPIGTEEEDKIWIKSLDSFK